MEDGTERLHVGGEAGGDASQAKVGEPVPRTLVPRRQHEKARVGPSVRKVARAPRGLDPETDLAGLVILSQKEPLPSPLQMPLERIQGDGPQGARRIGVRADGGDPHGAEVAEAEDPDLQEDDASPQRLVASEVGDDDPGIGVLEALDRLPQPFEGSPRHGGARRLHGHPGARADVAIGAARHGAGTGIEVALRFRGSLEGAVEFLRVPPAQEAPARPPTEIRRRGRWEHVSRSPGALLHRVGSRRG